MIKYLFNSSSKDLIKFYLQIYETALYAAVRKENIEIIKLLLKNEKIEVNKPTIFFTIFLILFKFKYF